MSIRGKKQRKIKSTYIRAGFFHKRKTIKKWEKIACAAAGSFFVLFLLLFRPCVQNTAYQLLNQGLSWLGKRQGKIYLFYKTENRTYVLFWIAAVWFVCLLAYLLYKRGRMHWRYAAVQGAALAAVFGLCLFAADTRCFFPLRDGIKTAEKALGSYIDDWRYGTNEAAGLPEGNLWRAGQKKADRQEQLIVTMSEPRDMYLRGFVGSVYEEGAWKPMEHQKKYKSRELFYWLHRNSFYGQTQLADLAQTVSSGKEEKPSETVVEVTNVSANRRYVYLPYELEKSPFLEENRIGDEQVAAQGFFGTDTYYFTMDEEVRTDYPRLLQKLASGSSESTATGRYQSCQSHYRKWVYASFLKVPDRFRRQFYSVFGEMDTKNGRIDVNQASQLILQYLNDKMEYEASPGVPEKKYDPLLYFLQQSGRGYDVQYASAAALMFRYMGIPARYVEGFLITKETAEKMEAAKPVSLDGSCGHAWTEIYVDGAGWVPFEAVPAMRDQVEEAQAIVLEESAQNRETGQRESQPDLQKKAENEQEEGQSAPGGAMTQQEEEKETPDFLKKYLSQIVFIVIIIMIVVIVLTIWTIEKKKRQLRAAFSQKDRKAACQAMFSYIMKRLEKRGVRLSKQSGIPEEYEACIKRQICAEYADKWKEAYRLHEYVCFGGKDISKEQYGRMCTFLEDTLRTLKRRRT